MGHPVLSDEHGIPWIKLQELVEAGQGQRMDRDKYLGMTLNEEDKLVICIKE